MVRPFGPIRLLVVGAALVAATACTAWQGPLGVIGQAEIAGPQGVAGPTRKPGIEDPPRAALDDTIESDMPGS
jgi:hypothetical protein